MGAVADLLLLYEGREANRATFPWCSLAIVLLTPEQIVYYLKKNANNEWTNTIDSLPNSVLLGSIDYSGKGMHSV